MGGVIFTFFRTFVGKYTYKPINILHMKTSMLKTITLMLIAILSLSVSAQKKNVMVHQTTGDRVSGNDLQKIHARIVEGLTNLPTINLLDPTNDGAEADLHFKCNVDSVKVYPKKDKEGKTTYTAVISLRAEVYKDGADENSGWSIPVDVFNSMVLTSFTTTKECLQSALDWVPKKVKHNFWEPFAVTGPLLSVESTKKDKAEEVSVAIGTLSGAEKKQPFDIYLPDPQIRDKKGKLKENKPIGEVKVTDLGDEISICKVSKGGDKIYVAFLEDPKQLTAKSKAPKDPFLEDKKYKAQQAAEYIWYANIILNSALDLYKDTKGTISDLF